MKSGGEKELHINDKTDNISLYFERNCLYRLPLSCKMTRCLRSISVPVRTCHNLVTTIKIIVLGFGCGMNGKQEQAK